MSLETDVFLYLPDTQVSEEFFRKIDKCFEKTGFKPTNIWGSIKPGFWAMVWIPEPTDEWVNIEWSERTKTLDVGNRLQLAYSLDKKGVNKFFLEIEYTGTMITNSMKISSDVDGFIEFYSELERDLSLRLQFVSQGLHKTLNVVKTEALVDYNDKPWFYFSGEKWQEIEELPLEKCTEPHLRIWAEHPDQILDWDYLRDEGIYPDPSTWQPKVPIEFDAQHNEIYLVCNPEIEMSGFTEIEMSYSK